MLYVKGSVKPSSIAGKGFFLEEEVEAGTVILNWNIDGSFITQEEYRKTTDPLILQTAVKADDNYMIVGDQIEDDDYINHSFSPNCEYSYGVIVASQKICQGEELTLNYRQIMIDDDPDGFLDVETGIFLGKQS